MVDLIDGNKLTRVQRDRVRRANERFNKMTQPQRAVAVAKDVILQLKHHRYKASRGVYINALIAPQVCNAPSAAALGKDDISCEVCARGGLFVSAAMLFNQCPLRGYYDTPSTIDRWSSGWDTDHHTFKHIERSIFSPTQIGMIEAAFECWDTTYPECAKFGRKYPDSQSRMVAIMENIVKNKGTFVP